MVNMNNNKALVLLRFMLLFLAFSNLLVSSSAVPSTRSLKSNKEFPSPVVQDLLAQDAMKLGETHELFGEESRTLMESTDYPGTGANRNHDPPKPPGRA